MGKFELETFEDFYNVVKCNRARFETEIINPTNAYNMLCSINHMKDWFEKDTTIQASIRKSAKTDFLDTYFDGESVLDCIRQLTNAQKHFDTEYKKQGKTFKTPETNVYKGSGCGRYGRGLYGVGEASYKINFNGKSISFLILVDQALSEWEKFLNSIKKEKNE